MVEYANLFVVEFAKSLRCDVEKINNSQQKQGQAWLPKTWHDGCNQVIHAGTTLATSRSR
jgi:hypothetical protein